MTSQKKTYIEPRDIKAVRFDCNDCGASLSLPLAVNMNPAPLAHCPNCGRSWATVMQTSIQKELKACADAILNTQASIARHQELVAQAGSKGFTVSLELAEPPAPASDEED